jgi:hypothetical protein
VRPAEGGTRQGSRFNLWVFALSTPSQWETAASNPASIPTLSVSKACTCSRFSSFFLLPSGGGPARHNPQRSG